MEANNRNYLLIQQYLNGVLDEKAMHELEKQALDDPFLADALEGYAQTKLPVGRQLSILQAQLQERIAQQQNTRNILSFSWQRLSIAAAAGLLFVTATILFWIKTDNAAKRLASNEKQVEVNLTASDSLKGLEELPSRDINESNASIPLKQDHTEIKAEEVSKKEKPIPNGATGSSPDSEKATELAKVYSTSSVKAESLAEVQVARIDQTLQGKPSGIVSASSPGNNSSPSVSISRKALSLNAKESSVAPAIGWEKYNEYLKSNTKTIVSRSEGFVSISFVVNQNGGLSNLKVEKSLNEPADLEALRVVKDGPAWQRGQDSTGTVSVKFGIEK